MITVIFETAKGRIASRQTPVIPRIGEIVSIDYERYRVEEVSYGFGAAYSSAEPEIAVILNEIY